MGFATGGALPPTYRDQLMAESKKTVYGAIAANSAIAVTKFVVAGVTGSSAMLSEGIHSVVDTGNGVLLLVGMKRASGRPTAAAPVRARQGALLLEPHRRRAHLRRGRRRVALRRRAAHRILRHCRTRRGTTSCSAAASVFEGISFVMALTAVRREQRQHAFLASAARSARTPRPIPCSPKMRRRLRAWRRGARRIREPSPSTCRYSMAWPRCSSACCSRGVAVLLIRESRGLLIGEGVRPETAAAIREIAWRQPSVRESAQLLSMYIGAEEVLLTLDVQFVPQTPVDESRPRSLRIERDIRATFPKIKRIYIEARAIAEVSSASSSTRPWRAVKLREPGPRPELPKPEAPKPSI